MGWKSTVDISRAEATRLIIQRICKMGELKNEELVSMLYALNYGDDLELEYYGNNFFIIDDEDILTHLI